MYIWWCWLFYFKHNLETFRAVAWAIPCFDTCFKFFTLICSKTKKQNANICVIIKLSNVYYLKNRYARFMGLLLQIWSHTNIVRVKNCYWNFWRKINSKSTYPVWFCIFLCIKYSADIWRIVHSLDVLVKMIHILVMFNL